jgi:hypothetical protein
MKAPGFRALCLIAMLLPGCATKHNLYHKPYYTYFSVSPHHRTEGGVFTLLSISPAGRVRARIDGAISSARVGERFVSDGFYSDYILKYVNLVTGQVRVACEGRAYYF